MRIFQVKTPTGEIVKVRADEDATDEELISFVQSQGASSPRSSGAPLQNAQEAETVYRALVAERGVQGANEVMLQWYPEVMGQKQAPPDVGMPKIDLSNPAPEPYQTQEDRWQTKLSAVPAKTKMQEMADPLLTIADRATFGLGPLAASGLSAAATAALYPEAGKGYWDSLKSQFKENRKDFRQGQDQFKADYPATATAMGLGGDLITGKLLSNLTTPVKAIAEQVTEKAPGALGAVQRFLGMTGKVKPTKEAVQTLKDAWGVPGIKSVGKSYLKAAGPAALVGAVQGATDAPEGGAATGAATGAALGATVPIIWEGAKGLGRGAKALAGVFKNAGPGVPDWTPQEVSNKIDEIGYNVLTNNGKTDMQSLIQRAALDRNALGADYGGARGAALLKAASSRAGNPQIDVLTGRANQTADRVRDWLEFGAPEVATARETKAGLETARKEVQSGIDTFLKSEEGQMPLSNSDEIADFLDLPDMKPIAAAARRRFHTKTGRDITFQNGAASAEGLITEATGEGVNRPVITPEYADYIKKKIESHISLKTKTAMEKVTPDTADWLDIEKQFQQLIDDGAVSGTHQKLAAEYGAIKRQQRAYDAGLAFNKTSETDLKDQFAALAPAEKKAFRQGATERLFEMGGASKNMEAGLLEDISKIGTRNKIGVIFGTKKIGAIEKAIEKERVYANTSKAASEGVQREIDQWANQAVSDSKSAGLPLLGHRRAYSSTGLTFATADALVEALGSKKMDPRVHEGLVNILMNSQNPAQALYAMEKRQLGREGEELMKLLKQRNTRNALYPAAVGALMGALQSREDR